MTASKLDPLDPKAELLARICFNLTKKSIQPEKLIAVPKWVLLADFEDQKH